jgi:hypothetical protein
MAAPCSNDSSFKIIKSWDDVTQFVGRVVAYQTDSDYFGPTQCFTVGNTRFGYIREGHGPWGETGEEGYNMVRVLKSQALFQPCALIASELKKNLSMRLATKEEVNLISKATTAGQAAFASMFYRDDEREILEHNLSML